jgi:hypothetical protein
MRRGAGWSRCAVERATMRALRAPAVHFVLLGATLVALARWSGPPLPRHAAAPGRTIVFGAADVERVRREWTMEHGVPPAPAEERRLIDDAIEDEVLYREALRIGLDRDDPVVRTRLVQLARYLEEGPTEDEPALETEARALGLDRTDVVVRRYLVESVRLVVAGRQQAELPSEAALAAYLARHADTFAQPPRMRFVHVYLSADRHGASLARDARALAARLRAGDVPLADAPALGDPFPRGAAVPLEPAADVDRRFGGGFAAALASAPLGTWTGPIASAYGLHLVWVQEREPARVPPLAEVRGQVLHRLLRERRAERVRAVLARLRRQYDVRVDGR